ncbi:MAG: ABC transporter permease, partial [Gemmatimonadetes bacterium]|nr:ABC transporter permease [Gemmatimonadota bacterium]
MIAQMFKLVWNRKRANLLLMGELLCAFMVVFAVATFGLYYANNFRRPLGFEYENVWSVYCLPDFSMLAKGGSTELGSAYASIYRELQQFEEIETVAGAESMVPYSMVSTSISTAQFEDAEVRAYTGRVSEGFFDALGLELVEGRWFDDSDAALTRGSIVITEQLRRDLFDETNAVGKIVQIGNHTSVGTPGQTSDEGLRVVGVVADFRRGGEFEGIDPVLFHRLELDDAETLNKYFPSHFLLKMRPGTPLALQERLATRIQSITTDLRLEFS